MTGSLESRTKARVRITKLRRAILSSLAIAGVLSVAVLAPNTLRLLKQPLNKGRRHNARLAIMSLSKKGLIVVRNGSVRITKLGEWYLKQAEHGSLSPRIPGTWDKKWRIIIFDIPESKSAIRRRLSENLKGMGFYRLQDSVWVFPYDVEELLALIKTDFQLEREVLYIIADEIEGDAPLRSHFKLKAR